MQVAECSSIRAAARSMHLSQSALTKALRELEEDVGAELLTRSYKGVEFTPAGTVLLSHARLALSILEKATEEIRRLRGGAGSHVVIAVTPRPVRSPSPACCANTSSCAPMQKCT